MNLKKIVLSGAILFSMATFAQKSEFRSIKRIYEKPDIKGKDLDEYKSLVAQLQPLVTEESDKVYANFYKVMIPVLEIFALDATSTPAQQQALMMKYGNPKSISEVAIALNATLDYEKKTGKKQQTDDIKENIAKLKSLLLNVADQLGGAKKYSESAEVLYSIYQLDKNDSLMLYYAANYSINAQDFDAALKYYQELKAINYSGEGTNFYAKNKASGQEEAFNSKADRDKYILLKTHEAPRDEKLESKRGEIYKNIAIILIDKGRTEEAKGAIQEARKLNPEDISLITSEADLYFKLKDMDSYKRLINEALAKSPDDPILLFNLGVVSSNSNQLEDAERYYKRVIELKPDYKDAYLNLAELNLRSDAKVVEEMNKLGNSDKELKKYDALKIERNKNFTKALPILKKAVELDPNDDVAKSALISVYKALDRMEEAKALQATMKK
ncbi:MAG: tetratricopeptide (TPR) repeat protein [Flavobacterium sp.]|jgi:tetratricopeptide (TPR) repeat protein